MHVRKVHVCHPLISIFSGISWKCGAKQHLKAVTRLWERGRQKKNYKIGFFFSTPFFERRRRVKTKCSKSRDLTAIAICDSNRESQITSDLTHCEPSQKSSLFWLVVWEIGIAILTAIWTEAQITNRAIWKCDWSRPKKRFGGNSCDLGSAISNH